jgi:DNA-binding transcriptional LysR family regulator
MHIETLKVFRDLVDLKSFSLAADRNFVTQSAVSQQIRSLEEKFKRRLLERVRGRREIKLTPAGEVFYRESKAVLEAYDQLQESLRGVVGKIGGTVKVATVYSVGLHELPGLRPGVSSLDRPAGCHQPDASLPGAERVTLSRGSPAGLRIPRAQRIPVGL